MPNNLIAQLDTLAALTPDQIAARLGNGNWVRFRDLTDEQFAFFQNKRMVLTEFSPALGFGTPNPGRYWRFWGNNSSEDRDWFRTRLGNHWGILEENYRDGHFPDLPTD